MKLADDLLCTGCAACHDACARGAVSMRADAEGFLRPRIDSARCVECRRCAEACPVLHRESPRKPISVSAAKAKDAELRIASSSGGVFSLLARQVLSCGGRIYGAAFDRADWSVRHVGVGDEAGLGELRGSKYLQSRTAGVYRKVEDDLKAGRLVLFSGTPCQIAALRRCLGREYDNLTLVDVVCHGVPSSLVWEAYLQSRAASAGVCASSGGRGVESVVFRRKDGGWRRYSLSLRFANGKDRLVVFSDDPFMRAFLAELCSRPSCYDCQFRELRSGADLTIGDFWGVDRFHPEMDDDCGTSLVLANTDKGLSLLERVRPDLDSVPATFEEAVSGNSALVESPRPHRNRNRFLRACSADGFDRLVERMLKPSVRSRMRAVAGRILGKTGVRK